MASLSEMLQFAKYKTGLEQQRAGAPALAEIANTAMTRMKENRMKQEMAEDLQKLEEREGKDIFPDSVTSGEKSVAEIAKVYDWANKYLQGQYQRERTQRGSEMLSEVTGEEPGSTIKLGEGGLTYAKEQSSAADLIEAAKSGEDWFKTIINIRKAMPEYTKDFDDALKVYNILQGDMTMDKKIQMMDRLMGSSTADKEEKKNIIKNMFNKLSGKSGRDEDIIDLNELE